ncbi:hypothetical protein LCGC14_1653580 [marine sediment metagenome]|uniref:Ig-like domain-containing protein n=1 Tax=marine sediment metagenome TaxID=412755 RepID=A0A0F9KC16_9ZZZZ
MTTINGVINKVAPRTVISPNGGTYVNQNGVLQLDYDKWGMVWNGNHFAPPDLSTKVYLPGIPGTGSTIFDFGGSTNGTIVGATWEQLPTGLPYLSFDGADDKVTISNPAVTTLEVGTVSMWIRKDAATSTQYIWCYVKEASASVDVMRVGIAGSEELIIDWLENGVNNDGLDTDNGVITISKWHRITFTSDGSTIVCYVDGAPKTLNVLLGANNGLWFADLQTEPADTLVIGGYYRLDTLVSDFAGDIALFRMTSATRSADDEARQFAAERHLFGV